MTQSVSVIQPICCQTTVIVDGNILRIEFIRDKYVGIGVHDIFILRKLLFMFWIEHRQRRISMAGTVWVQKMWGGSWEFMTCGNNVLFTFFLFTVSGEVSINCAGSLISKKYVLTASHCITGEILLIIVKMLLTWTETRRWWCWRKLSSFHWLVQGGCCEDDYYVNVGLARSLGSHAT
jgi:hypothetical protein